MNITIYHNPDCGTSRNVVRLVKDAGYKPEIVEYLQIGWTLDKLTTLFDAAGISARDALRVSKSPAFELGLTDPNAANDTIISAMLKHPILVNRPFVVCQNGVKLCRPSGEVLDLLDTWPSAPYAKEDGSWIIDANGIRVPGQ
ncbi:MAG: arsenate reductase (glutaredoxin) [Pseudomonadota bacterium]